MVSFSTLGIKRFAKTFPRPRMRGEFLPLVFLFSCGQIAFGQEIKFSPGEIEKRIQEADNDPVQLLLLSSLAGPPQAQSLREQVRMILQEKGKELPANELKALGRRLSRTAEKIGMSKAAVAEAFGKSISINRQFLFRRYLEQWRFEKPTFMVFVFLCNKGETARLIRVTVKANSQE